MAIILPTAAQAALQTPLNTFSPTSSPLPNTVNGLTYNYNPALGVWTSAATGSGLAAATLAEAAAGTLNTVYSSPQTSVPKNASGMTGSALIPAGNTAARPAAGLYAGQFRYNTQIPQLEYSDGVSWIAVGTQAASLAEAAAGTLTTKYLSPETGVPKNASGMTGSALIPAGNTGARPAAASYTGALRYNTQIPQMEYSDGATWLPMGGSKWTVSGTNIFPTTATVLQFNSGYGSNANAYGVRAWANFSGNGVGIIRASGNISSVTYIPTGVYQCNFINPMPDLGYAVVPARTTNTTGSATVFWYTNLDDPPAPAPSTTSFTLASIIVGSVGQDSSMVSVAVFR